MTDLDEQRERAHAAREQLVGKTIAGRYVLRGLVGHGGMGAVYEAEHLGLGKRVAIKFVDPEFATDENVVARFAREARAMSAIESAHIVTVFDAGAEDGRPYLVMELLRGEDLGQRLRRMRRIPLPEAMHVIAQVLKGLARAHTAGIVHRDLKPDNVFLVKHDTDPLFAKIVDFGVSKIERPRANTSPLALTGRGTVLGTPFYMSPEQAQASSEVDARADLYSVGAILFECLTGRPPHTGESYEQVILSICMRDAPQVRTFNPSVPLDVSAFVARALSRDRNQRFASAERMLAALHEVAPAERARVPLDPPSAATMVSPGASLDATVLDGGAPARSSRPSGSDEVSAATRLGVATLGAGSSVDTERTPDPHKPTVGPAVPVAPAASKNVRKEPKDPKARRVSSDQPVDRVRTSAVAAVSPRRPIGTALITAAVATLMGVGVTFGVITMLSKKPASDVPPATSIATTNASAPAASTGSAMPALSAAPGVSASASAATAPIASGSSSPAGSGKLGTVSTPRPTGSPPVIPPLPRPTSTKPLDINRDLP